MITNAIVSQDRNQERANRATAPPTKF